MKGLKKLVLASAIIAASSSSFAMQVMDDESMAAATGQDGLTISLDNSLTTDLKWIDRDGFTGKTNAGGVVISNLGITANDVTINIDAGGSAGTGAGANGTLQIGIGTGSATVIDLSSTTIGVADAVNVPGGGWGAATLAARSATGATTDVLRFDTGASLTIAASANLMNIQLGNEQQGAFIRANANLGTITLTGIRILDASATAGAGAALDGDEVGISVGTLTLDSLNAVAAIDVVAGGLQIDTTGTTIGAIGLERVKLGTLGSWASGTYTPNAALASIGDVYLSNLNLNAGTITVTGH